MMLTAINVPDASPASDDFTELVTRHPLHWIRLSGLPAGHVEPHIAALRLPRYRAALQAARAVGPRCFVVSHLPLMTAAVAHAMGLARRQAPHLGFAFNFTTLPRGLRYRYLQKALAGVDQLAVFSTYEKERYARYFDLDPARIVPVIWTQAAPPVQQSLGFAYKQPYLCAIGGEGRDFALLMQAARLLGPAVTVVVIARPHSLAGLQVPANVKVLTNIALAQTWRIAADSCGVLVPLLSRQTCCGQITLVSAKLLGLPMATTQAYATDEYVQGRAGVLQCAPGDVAAFTDLARRLVDDHATLGAVARECVVAERAVHDRRHWADYLDAFIEKKNLC